MPPDQSTDLRTSQAIDRVAPLCALLHPNPQVSARVLATVIEKEGKYKQVMRRNLRARESARQRAANAKGTRLRYGDPASHKRDAQRMDDEWRWHLAVLQASDQYWQQAGTSSLVSQREAVLRYLALLVQKSMEYQPAYAAVCLGTMLYDCNLISMFEHAGLGKNVYDSTRKTIGKNIEARFSVLPDLVVRAQ